MRRRIGLLIATLFAAVALSASASAVEHTVSENGGPQICVWSYGVYAVGYWIPLYVPYTCTPPPFR